MQYVTQFAVLDQQLNEKVNKIDMDIFAGKKEKLLRNKLDYELNNVYVWKKTRPLGRFGNSHKKRVSFSNTEPEIMDNTLVVSDGSSDQSGASGVTNEASTPVSSKNIQHKFNSKKFHHNKKTRRGEHRQFYSGMPS